MTHLTSRLPRAISVLLAVSACAGVASAQSCTLEWISQPMTAGGWSSGDSPVLSADGRIVAYWSYSSELVAGDLNQDADVFVHDRATGVTTLVSLATSGVQANGWSGLPSISGDGRFVAFKSAATNLDPQDSHPGPDIYRHDRQTGETVLVSVYSIPPSSYGAMYSSMSYDGRFVAFDTWERLVPADVGLGMDAYVRDLQTGQMELVSVDDQGIPGNDVSESPSVSWDGRYVAFASLADNLVPGNTEDFANVYVRDRLLGTTQLVSYAPSGTFGTRHSAFTPSISGDGTKVAFMGFGPGLMPSLYEGPTWRGPQVYVRDLNSGTLTYIGYSIQGGLSSHTCSKPKLSYDGRYVAWMSLSNDLSVTPGHGNEDVYLRDLETGVTVQISQGAGGSVPNGYSLNPSLSADGRTVAFMSMATNLGPAGMTTPGNVFVRECDVASPTIYCASAGSASGCKPVIGSSGSPSASAGSGFVITGSQLVTGQTALVLYATRPSYAPGLGSGWLCLEPPVTRTPALTAGGFASCDGSIGFDMNAWIASGADPLLQSGSTVYAQVWSRDPLELEGGVLSDALAFLIAP
jgi:Tol biopolymer transport system component